MKTKIAVIYLIILSYFSYAQSTASVSSERISFGIRAGIDFQNLNGKDALGNSLKNDLAVRYDVGANVAIPIAPDFYIQPGLLFRTKGAKVDWGLGSGAVNLYYLELPIHLLYKPLLGTGRLILGFGPYLAYGIGGKTSYSGTSYDVTFENTNDPLKIGRAFKPFDAGADLAFGYEFSNRLSFQLNAQLGLVNISPDYGNSTTVKNTGFGISAGYRF